MIHSRIVESIDWVERVPDQALNQSELDRETSKIPNGIDRMRFRPYSIIVIIGRARPACCRVRRRLLNIAIS